MSGQDYAYLVWKYEEDSFGIAELVTTFPTKYQSFSWIDRQSDSHDYFVMRWRHGDKTGHKVER